MLILSRKLNQKIIIDSNIEITILDIKGDQIKIGIRAPNNVKVYRYELYKEICDENKNALSFNLNDFKDFDLKG